MDFSNLNFLSRVLAGDIEVEHYDGSSTLSTSWQNLLNKTVPEGYKHVIVGIAVDNSVAGELDILIEGKTVLPETMRIDTFPANKDYRPMYIVVDSRNKWTFKAKADTGTPTLTWEIMVFKVRGGII